MQEMQHPDGTISREFFSDKELKAGRMAQRRRELQAQGYSVTRIAYIVKQGKYTPHQGPREMARRIRQMQRDGVSALESA